MRFLLNTSKAALRKTAPKANASTRPTPSNSVQNVEPGKTWGQQCSPHCGCTVRFETSFNPNNNNTILSASYDAKTIVTKVSKGKDGSTFLKPIMTKGANDQRPMLKECKCTTLKSLAEAVCNQLPGQTLAQAQNQLEFTGVRSSLAFRYTVLRNLELISTVSSPEITPLLSSTSSPLQLPSPVSYMHDIPEGRCFDLVEEALVACLKGYIPKPRLVSHFPSTGSTNEHNLKTVYRTDSNQKGDSKSNSLDPLRFVNAAKKRAKETGMDLLQSLHKSSSDGRSSPTTTSLSSSSPSSMPPFHLMGEPDNTVECTLTQIKMEKRLMEDEEKKRKSGDDYMSTDWVSYIDEVKKE